MKFEKNENNWQEMLELYIDYRHEFGCEPGYKEVYKNRNLGTWMRMQRDSMKNGHLSAERKQKLTKAGFRFAPKRDRDNARWEKMFALYVEYKQEFTQEPQANTIYKGEKLGEWVRTQRKNDKKGILSKERKRRLVSAGFVFVPEEMHWQKMLELYEEFKQEFEREPKQNEQYKGEKLGAWVAGLTYRRKNGNVALLRENQLDEVAFGSQGSQRKLQKMIDLYLAFKEEYHREPSYSDVYQEENLGAWLDTQKKNAKRGKMSPERLNLLTNSGVVLFEDVKEIRWNEACELYIEYVRKYGRGPATKEVYKGVRLELWVRKQKQRSKAEKEWLRQQYKAFLLENGYSEDPLEKYWKEMYCLCLEFVQNNNRNPKNKEVYKEKPLGNWFFYQNKLRKYGWLSDEQIRLLSCLYTQ